mgnify:CR=1 FL=1
MLKEKRAELERVVKDVYLENLIMHYDLNLIEIKILQYITEESPNTKIAHKLKIKETEVVNYTKFLYYKPPHTKHIEEVKQKLVDQLPL